MAVLAVISLAFPSVRRLLREKALPTIRRAGAGVAYVVRHPAKLALLVGGSARVTTAYILAVQLSILSFDADPPIAQVGAVYLVAATIATAAPTPAASAPWKPP